MMNEATPLASDPAVRYRQARITHWDDIARQSETWRGRGGYYHRRLAEVYQFWVAPGQRVLELGCAQGDLLAALQPSNGVGVDFSGEMINRARKRHPALRFIQADARVFESDETFDVIILSDLLNDAWDVQSILERVAHMTEPHTRLLINTYSRLWEPVLGLAGRLNLATPVLHQNWLTVHDVKGLLSLAGFETIRQWQEVLWPFDTPLLHGFSILWLVARYRLHRAGMWRSRQFASFRERYRQV